MSERVEALLREARVIAVVGLSDRPGRPSHGVARYLLRAGYDVIPVNPNLSEALGRRAWPDLSSIPERVDIVDIFRRSEFVAPIVQEAIAVGAKMVWMQDGVRDDDAARAARAAGLEVVMDDCILREHARLIGTNG